MIKSSVYQQSSVFKCFRVYQQVKRFSPLFKSLLVLFESLSQAGVAGQRTVARSVNFMAGWSCLLMVRFHRGYGKPGWEDEGARERVEERERQLTSSKLSLSLVACWMDVKLPLFSFTVLTLWVGIMIVVFDISLLDLLLWEAQHVTVALWDSWCSTPL